MHMFLLKILEWYWYTSKFSYIYSLTGN